MSSEIEAWPDGRAGLAKAAVVVAHDTIAVGKRAELVVPHVQVGDTRMQKDQRMPLASHFVVEFRAVDVGVACRHIPSVRHSCSAPLLNQRPASCLPPELLFHYTEELSVYRIIFQ